MFTVWEFLAPRKELFRTQLPQMQSFQNAWMDVRNPRVADEPESLRPAPLHWRLPNVGAEASEMHRLKLKVMIWQGLL